MPNPLEIIAAKTRTQLSQAGPDTPSHRILSLLNELLAALQLPPESQNTDLVTNLRIENGNLRAQLADCQNRSADVNFLTMAMLEIGRITGLPADKKMSDLVEWVRTHWKGTP